VWSRSENRSTRRPDNPPRRAVAKEHNASSANWAARIVTATALTVTAHGSAARVVDGFRIASNAAHPASSGSNPCFRANAANRPMQ
jgi:hypothetical protein